MNFFAGVISKSKVFHSTESVRDLELLEPVTRSAVKSILMDAAHIGIELRVTETYRSQERQQALFLKGATQLQTVGCHHFGVAADFCKIINGVPSWAGDWSFLRDLAEKHGLISGLDWGLPGRHGFVDPDHVQRPSLGEQSALLSGSWYPEAAQDA